MQNNHGSQPYSLATPRGMTFLLQTISSIRWRAQMPPLWPRIAPKCELNGVWDKQASVLPQVERSLAQIEISVAGHDAGTLDRILETMGGLTNRIISLTQRVEELATAVESQPTSTTTADPSAPAGPWNYSPELRSVQEANISAYTAVESPDGDLLLNSLFQTIKGKVNAMGAQWVTQQLPPVVNGLAEVAATSTYHTLVRDAGKHARERMHHLVLHNIRNPPGVNAKLGTVPNIKRLLHRRVDPSCLNCIPSVRNFQSIRAGHGANNIWRCIDRQLARMSAEGPLYTMAFYKLVYDNDCAVFTGTVKFEELEDMEDPVRFEMPLEDEIREEMDRVQAQGQGQGLEMQNPELRLNGLRRALVGCRRPAGRFTRVDRPVTERLGGTVTGAARAAHRRRPIGQQETALLYVVNGRLWAAVKAGHMAVTTHRWCRDLECLSFRPPFKKDQMVWHDLK
ncbi:uncharacterized protein MELLADRAFT_91109 [Melampsora larici-populina 98AG31]|uniref:Uncharacterized protein n=1 Tax=Melampsora larici-populina (strain 98AG31 / pathotype 3-4-7) TaxID=747676 RepID=F4R766_MELLP|nr:uncharacterized protein MELLADRAFT_91109 [Melampsora larici-populina 98AG31]EGG11536.1 hypothetical protein MELLADRAFT_91109 [Melampsora larici-populina 98AG31]